MDIEAVGTGQILTGLEVHAEVALVHLAGHLIRGQDHDDIGLGCSPSRLSDGEPGVFGFGPGGTAFLETDPDIHPAVTQVERVGMALAAIAEDGDLLALEQREVRVFVVIDVHAAFSLWGDFPLSSTASPWVAADKTCTPRCIATLPVRTVSLMPSGFSRVRMALSFSSSPVTSMM